jgi:probable aminopeptidase NPEPL1
LLILDDKAHLLAAANAVAKAIPLFSMKTGERSQAKLLIMAVDKKGKPLAAGKSAKDTLKATREAARLVDSPPTDMNPEALAQEARKLLRGVANVSFSEIRGDALLKAKLGAIHAVGRSAKKAPRLLIAKYRPRGAKGAHVALVGKGITYDTGGLHIKMRGFMESMKCDMGGAAATLGAFYVLAASGIKRPISLLLCLAENAIGPDAYKPDDIVTMHSGKTVEINNTDAEGRLVLGDGVSYAARVLKADTILDAATLTGAQMISTGQMHSAIVSNDAKLERTTVEAGHASGDLAHPMLFAPELYKQELSSPVADMVNSVHNRMNAQASCAAQFVYWQIEDCKVRWCHVDMAGPAWIKNRGTGYGVALLSEMVRSLPR